MLQALEVLGISPGSVLSQIWGHEQVIESFWWPISASMKWDTNPRHMSLTVLLYRLNQVRSEGKVYRKSTRYDTNDFIYLPFVRSFMHRLLASLPMRGIVQNISDSKMSWESRGDRHVRWYMTDYTMMWIQVRYYYNVPITEIDSVGATRALTKCEHSLQSCWRED